MYDDLSCEKYSVVMLLYVILQIEKLNNLDLTDLKSQFQLNLSKIFLLRTSKARSSEKMEKLTTCLEVLGNEVYSLYIQFLKCTVVYRLKIMTR